MGHCLEGHPAIPSGWCSARSGPEINLYTQMPAACGLTASAHCSRSASIVGLGLSPERAILIKEIGVLSVLRSENFIHGRKRRTRLWTAGNHVNGLSDGDDSQTVARGGHGRPTLPGIIGGIVGFGLIVGS